jgi:hypothetical protein
MLNFGKKSDKRCSYLSANWILGKTLNNGDRVLKSINKNVDDIVVQAKYLHAIKEGWR